MCAPLALMAASMALSAKANSDQVKAQNEAFDANAKAAHEAKIIEDIAANEDREVAETAASAEKLDRSLEGEKLKATAAVSAGEAGVSGNSINALMNTLQADVEKGNLITTQNLQLSQRGSERQLSSNRRSAQSRINSVAKGNKSAARLQIASDALSSYNSYNANK